MIGALYRPLQLMVGCWLLSFVLGCHIQIPPIPWPVPSVSPIPSPTPESTPVPTPVPTPTPVGPPVTVPTPPPTPVPTPTPLGTPAPAPSPCISPCPPEAWTCMDKQEWEVGRGNWGRLPRSHPFRGIYGCPPGVPDAPGCAGGVCLNSRCDRVNCSTGSVLAPAEDGWFGICTPRVVACPSPIPSPAPSPTGPPPPGCTMPSSCPALVIWRGSVLSCQDSNHRVSKRADGSPLPVPGGKCHIDSTPGFEGGPRGLPCNEDHHAACSCTGADVSRDDPGWLTKWRRCEDPRGPNFTVSGPGVASWSKDDFGADIRHSSGGEVVVEICPPSDMRDAYGVPVRVVGSACRTVRYTY